jgi:hypothetical protein
MLAIIEKAVWPGIYHVLCCASSTVHWNRKSDVEWCYLASPLLTASVWLSIMFAGSAVRGVLAKIFISPTGSWSACAAGRHCLQLSMSQCAPAKRHFRSAPLLSTGRSMQVFSLIFTSCQDSRAPPRDVDEGHAIVQSISHRPLFPPSLSTTRRPSTRMPLSTALHMS